MIDIPEISVIVPVYNVQDYVGSCVESILKQTFKNFELLLIDDGSTDNSGEICKAYANKYKMISFLRKKNGGLSDARNYGMRFAKGKYFTFIDSDDFVDSQYLELLYYMINKYKVKISCVGSYREYETDLKLMKVHENLYRETKIVNKNEAISIMLTRRGFGVNAWGKMYERSLFRQIKYPKGKLFEDLLTTPYLFEQCDEVSYSRVKLYHYLKRSDSILNRGLKNSDLILIDNLYEIKSFTLKKHPYLVNQCNYRFMTDVLKVIINRAVASREGRIISKKIFEMNKNIWDSYKINEYLSEREKLQIFFAMHSSFIYCLIIKMALIFKSKLH